MRLKSERLESMVSLRLVFCLSLAALLSGCGSDTSWYFCSGSEEFCRVDLPDVIPAVLDLEHPLIFLANGHD